MYLQTGATIGEDCGVRVQIGKGGAARLSFDGLPEQGMGSLEWVLTPKTLRKDGLNAGRKRRASQVRRGGVDRTRPA